MVQNINKLKGKMAENNYTMKRLSAELGMTETTLRRKMNMPEADFLLSESQKISQLLGLTTEEYLNIFFDSQLEFNA